MTEFDRIARRGKPQREIYRPGSGPLRKSGKGDEDLHLSDDYRNNLKDMNSKPGYRSCPRNAEIEKIAEVLKKVNMSSNIPPETNTNLEVTRKPRKPDNALYVPRPMQSHVLRDDKEEKVGSETKLSLSRDDEKSKCSGEVKKKSIPINNERPNAEKPKKRSEGKKRKGKGRSGGKEEVNHPEDRPPPLMQDLITTKPDLIKSDNIEVDLFGKSRFSRHGSEPRSAPLPSQENRSRDTRSVEPCGPRVQEKSYTKPPSGHHGRRGNGNKLAPKTLPLSFNSLPPRLKKKYMAEYGITEPISENGSGEWELNSNSSQGNGSRHQLPSHSGSFNKSPMPLMCQPVPPPAIWSQTLPSPGGRGRGRVRGDIDECNQSDRYSRSLTPESVGSINDNKSRYQMNERLKSPSRDSELGERGKIDSNYHEEKENWRSDGRHEPIERNKNSDWRHEGKLWKPSNDIKNQVDNLQSPPKKEDDVSQFSPEIPEITDVLDWAAEVERSEQLESLTISQTGSHESFVEPMAPPPKDKKKKKKRSLSRDMGRESLGWNNARRGSFDNPGQSHSRNSSLERRWGRGGGGGRGGGDPRGGRRMSGGERSSRQSSAERYNDSHYGSSRHRNNSVERRNRYVGGGGGGRHGSRERRDSVRHGSRERRDNGRHESRERRDNGRHGSRERKDSGRHGSRERRDSGRHGSRERRDSVRHGSRERKDSGKHGSRERRDSGRHGSRERKDSGRHGSRERRDSGRHGSRERRDTGRHGSRERRDSGRHGSRERRDSGRHGSRERRDSGRHVEEMNWRLEKLVSCREGVGGPIGDLRQAAGIIVLPQPVPREEQQQQYHPPPPPHRGTQQHHQPPHHETSSTRGNSQRHLYDPSNPGKPIQVPCSGRSIHENDKYHGGYQYHLPEFLNTPPQFSDQFSTAKPVWYHPYPDSIRGPKSLQLLRSMEQTDFEMQYILSTTSIIHSWEQLQKLRNSMKKAFRELLLTELKFCQGENVEQHLWKILYYNIIELLRKLMIEEPDSKKKYKDILLGIIEEGTEFFEGLLEDLERTYKFKLDTFLSAPVCLREGLGFIGLALVATQKLFLCLGDLARYKEQANDSCSYGLARQWYMKAHQINPKNGRPYNQLALLAMYTKRKLDAVYYYMRSLMASNPLLTARESLLSLFDENRKKYEGTKRKQKDERAMREKEKMKEKESGNGLRREIWVHPRGGKNVHRTTSATAHSNYDSEDEELYSATDIEVNKRFCMSYLHVHGKFFTKIGLETLNETAAQMLKEFRALLQHSPIPLNSVRFLQLLALNMFAIEITQPKDINQMEPSYRPALQESALVVSLQMFNLMLERFVHMLKEHLAGPEPPPAYIVPSDCLALLPAIKVWCDWLMTHVDMWNPPPSCQDYKVGPPGDCWIRLATLVSLLEKLDYKRNLLSTQEAEGYELVYLPEDATLCGFTPLMANAQDPIYTSKETDMELAQVSLRIHKVLFFGSVFLCGLDPPVLKVHKLETGVSEYVSVVDTPNSQEQSDTDVCIESESSTNGESEDSGKATGLEDEEVDRGLDNYKSGELQSLIIRKGELERVHRRQLKRNKHVQKILSQQAIVLEMEVRPHYLVPDTNCFVDYLPQLESIIKMSSSPHPQHPYTIMVPLIVINELDGLSKGCKPSQSMEHAALVREGARSAMIFLQTKHAALRCVTTRGTVLSSAAFTFEEETEQEMKNDDKILATCLNLGQSYSKDEPNREVKDGSPRKIFRNVVLLTDDRNLRVKALARDVPVRELPDFMRWADLVG